MSIVITGLDRSNRFRVNHICVKKRSPKEREFGQRLLDGLHLATTTNVETIYERPEDYDLEHAGDDEDIEFTWN